MKEILTLSMIIPPLIMADRQRFKQATLQQLAGFDFSVNDSLPVKMNSYFQTDLPPVSGRFFSYNLLN
jgi:hypothetical protein